MASCGNIHIFFATIPILNFLQVKHHFEQHYPSEGTWRKLLSTEEEEARQVEEVVLQRLSEDEFADVPSDHVVWSCMHCHDLPIEKAPMSIRDMDIHLRRVYVARYSLHPSCLIKFHPLRHDILESQLDLDYAKDFAAPQVYQTDGLFQISLVGIEL